MQTVINWTLFNEQKPPEYIDQYIIYDSNGEILTAEWFEGSCFKESNEGSWIGEDGMELTNVIYWAEKPVLN